MSNNRPGTPPPADYVIRVERACAQLATDGTPITADAVAALAGIGRATLYRRPELRALIEEHRRHAREALTLTGLAVRIDQLRDSLEAVAGNVRRHEEQLRRLNQQRSKADRPPNPLHHQRPGLTPD